MKRPKRGGLERRGPKGKPPPLTAIGVTHSTMDRKKGEPNTQVKQLFRILEEEKVKRVGFETTKIHFEALVEEFAKSSRKYGVAFNEAYARAKAGGVTEAEALVQARKAALAERLQGEEAMHRYILALKRLAKRKGIEVVPVENVAGARLGGAMRHVITLLELQQKHVPPSEGIRRLNIPDLYERGVVEKIVEAAGNSADALTSVFNAINVHKTIKKYQSARKAGLTHFIVGVVDAWQLRHLYNARLRLTSSRQDTEQRALEAIEDYKKKKEFVERLEKIAGGHVA